MNILLVNYEYPPLGGGGGVAAEQVAVELVAMGHRVDVITSSGPGVPDEETRGGVRIVRAPVRGRKSRETASLLSMLSFVTSAIRAGKQLMRERRYDLVHVHFAVPSGPAGLRLGRFGKCPVVVSLHGGDLYDPVERVSPHRIWPAKLVVKHVLKKADLLLAQSSDTVGNARRYYGFRGRIEVVPLGLPPPEFTPTGRDRFGLEENDAVLVTIGRLVKRKAVGDLVEAVAGLGRESVKLFVVGEGPERPNIEAQIDALGLQGRVPLPGFLGEKEKFQLLDLADLFVMSSLHEGFGIIYLEAMSAGLPIVATNVGGHTDFLKPERNALLVPVHDPAALTAAIDRVLRDADLREAMGRNNRSDVERFHIRRIAERHVELFEEVCS
jgi:glycosyltransferase involved in cell wall biosynthesis